MGGIIQKSFEVQEAQTMAAITGNIPNLVSAMVALMGAPGATADAERFLRDTRSRFFENIDKGLPGKRGQAAQAIANMLYLSMNRSFENLIEIEARERPDVAEKMANELRESLGDEVYEALGKLGGKLFGVAFDAKASPGQGSGRLTREELDALAKDNPPISVVESSSEIK
jgi:hypothetical protein